MEQNNNREEVMKEVTIHSRNTYHVFCFEGETLKEVHFSCTTPYSRVINTTYLPDMEYPVVSLYNDLQVCVPLNAQELEAVSQNGGLLSFFGDDLYSIKVSPLGEIEKGFIDLFYKA